MHPYRTHTCGELRRAHAGKRVRLSGWVHRRRDHGGVLFIDLRDHYGLAQLVLGPGSPFYQEAARLPRESVLTATGSLVERSPDTLNPELPTGEVELRVEDLQVLSPAAPLPFPVAEEQATPEALRLTYRFLDLRRQALQRTIALRASDLLHAPAHAGDGLYRDPHAHPHLLLPRRRPRLSGAQPPAPGPLLRPAPGAAAIQATAHGRRLRPLLPDRPLLPRRGRPRRPLARRVLPARPGDGLCRAGGHLPRGRDPLLRALRRIQPA